MRKGHLWESSSIIHTNKMNALKTGSLKLSNWILNHFDQQNITTHFHQKQNKKVFITSENLSIGITWISFQKGLWCPPECRVWALSLCFLYFCLVKHNHLSCFYEKLKFFGSFGFFFYHAPALREQLWSLSFFALAPPMWGMILVKVIFKNIIGSKWDCKGYISGLWKDYQRWSFLISNACI